MRKFRAILQSSVEPEDKETLWYHNGELYYYNNGSWDIFLKKVYMVSPEGEGIRKLVVFSKLSKDTVSLEDPISLQFGFMVVDNYGSIIPEQEGLIKVSLTYNDEVQPFYTSPVIEVISSNIEDPFCNEIDLSGKITSDFPIRDVIVRASVNYTYEDTEGSTHISKTITESNLLNLHIKPPKFSIIEIDESVLDEAYLMDSQVGCITNLDNNTGYRTSTPYKPSSHIMNILNGCHRYLGKLVKLGSEVEIPGNSNDPSDLGKKLKCRNNDGTMLLIQLNDTNSFYYNKGFGTDKQKIAPLDGAISSGEVGTKIPGFWYKGVNLNTHKNPNSSKRYICISSFEEKPESSDEVVSIPFNSLTQIPNGSSKNGLYASGNRLYRSGASDYILNRISKNILFDIFRIDVEGFKKIRYPVSISGSEYSCDLFTDADNKIITDKSGSVTGIGELYIGKEAFLYDGMSIIATIPEGAKYFYISRRRGMYSNSNITVESCDIILHKGTKFDKGEAMNESNIKDWIADMEPQWVYSDPMFIHSSECTYDHVAHRLYTSFDSTKTAITGTATADNELESTNDWFQYRFSKEAFSRGLQLIDYEASKILTILFMAKYGRRNSQLQLGLGRSANDRLLGVTAKYGMQDSTLLPTSTVDNPGEEVEFYVESPEGKYYESADSPSFLGLENIHGNVAECLDRAYYANETALNSGKVRITMPDFSIRKVFVPSITSNSFVKSIVGGRYCDILACAHGASDKTGYTDAQQPDSTKKNTWKDTTCIYRSGYASNQIGGMFYLNGSSKVSSSYKNYGTRLMFRGNIIETDDIQTFSDTKPIKL